MLSAFMNKSDWFVPFMSDFLDVPLIPLQAHLYVLHIREYPMPVLLICSTLDRCILAGPPECRTLP